MDAALTHWINAAAGISPLLDKAMIGVSQIGVPLMVLAVVPAMVGEGRPLSCSSRGGFGRPGVSAGSCGQPVHSSLPASDTTLRCRCDASVDCAQRRLVVPVRSRDSRHCDCRGLCDASSSAPDDRASGHGIADLLVENLHRNALPDRHCRRSHHRRSGCHHGAAGLPGEVPAGQTGDRDSLGRCGSKPPGRRWLPAAESFIAPTP